MTDDYAATVRAHARLTALKLLVAEPDYALNESMLRELMRPFGFELSRDRVRGMLAWLAEQGLITSETVADLMVARITERGEDVARGRAGHPGVKRPGP